MSDTLRVLFLSQVLPYPLDAGPKVRAYHVLRRLAARHEVILVGFRREDDPPASLDHLRRICREVHTVPMRRGRLRDLGHLAASLARGRSFILARDERRAMRRLLSALSDRHRFDVVHADQLWMAGYARRVPAGARVLDNHNAVHQIFDRLADGAQGPLRRWMLRREARLIGADEARQCLAFDHTIFVSQVDRSAVRRLLPAEDRPVMDERTSVLPICLDLAAVEPIEVRSDARRLTLLGTMLWPPNAEGARWFAETVLPRLLVERPELKLTIIGKQPPAALRRLSGAHGGAVEVPGYVPELRPYLEETALFLVPLRAGGGMRVKILDAWAWGLPVVSTRVGAEGIAIRPGVDIAIADEPAELARTILDLMADPSARARMAAAGRSAVERHYDADVVYGALDPIYDALPRSSMGRGA